MTKSPEKPDIKIGINEMIKQNGRINNITCVNILQHNVIESRGSLTQFRTDLL